MKKILVALMFAIFLTACGAERAAEPSPNGESPSPSYTQPSAGGPDLTDAPEKADYKKISAEEAKDIMDSGENYILLDVRTEEEYATKRIEGALLIPDYDIADRAESELPDKDALILLYCRSGRRSESAAKKLLDMGYTNVLDFGGINDWPYDTVSG